MSLESEVIGGLTVLKPKAPEEGQGVYMYMAWADDDQGTNLTSIPAGKAYLAILLRSTPLSSAPVASDFTGLWLRVIGEQGPAGQDGSDGADGADGQAGIDGQNAYLYVRFATDALGTGFSSSPVGMSYIAIKNTSTPIPTPAVGDFDTWTKFVGADGQAGANGMDGADGASAYQIWLDLGNAGTQTQFIASLKGATGDAGAAGKSAYQSWLDLGNSGTEAQFIASLKGADGTNGTNGTNGADGKSAYQSWLDSGHTGTEAEFIAAIKGDKGDKGDDGAAGSQGIAGTDGLTYYPYLRYADASDGTGFSTTPTATTAYLGLLWNTSDSWTPVASDYTGLWIQTAIAGGGSGGGAAIEIVNAMPGTVDDLVDGTIYVSLVTDPGVYVFSDGVVYDITSSIMGTGGNTGGFAYNVIADATGTLTKNSMNVLTSAEAGIFTFPEMDPGDWVGVQSIIVGHTINYDGTRIIRDASGVEDTSVVIGEGELSGARYWAFENYLGGLR